MKNIVLVIIIILVISSLSCVCATEDNCTLENITSVDYLRTIQDNFNKIVDNFHNHLDRNFNIKNINNNANNSLNINIYYNKSNLVNLSTNKDKHNVGLFNGTLHNQNQYNKTCKLLGLNHSVNNDSIFNNKELNISKSNSNMCDDSSEDNFLINPVPESDNKDYNILLLILLFLLVLLGAIILYKIKK